MVHGCSGDRWRRGWQNPETILAQIGLRSGSVFVDVGCGSGFFALPAARLVGKTGRVYGVDIDPDAIETLSRRAAEEGLDNLDLKVGEAEETLLAKGRKTFSHCFQELLIEELRWLGVRKKHIPRFFLL